MYRNGGTLADCEPARAPGTCPPTRVNFNCPVLQPIPSGSSEPTFVDRWTPWEEGEGGGGGLCLMRFPDKKSKRRKWTDGKSLDKSKIARSQNRKCQMDEKSIRQKVNTREVNKLKVTARSQKTDCQKGKKSTWKIHHALSQLAKVNTLKVKT